MIIELDAVVNEYVLDALEAVEASEAPARRARDVVEILATLIEEGLVRHRYSAAQKTDRFRATPSLVLRWRHDFPEVGEIADPTDTIIVQVGGDRETFLDKLAQYRSRRAMKVRPS